MFLKKYFFTKTIKQQLNITCKMFLIRWYCLQQNYVFITCNQEGVRLWSNVKENPGLRTMFNRLIEISLVV